VATLPLDIVRVREQPGLTIVERPYMVVGIPDVGLAGTIAATFIVRKLQLPISAEILDDRLPPIALLRRGLPYSPYAIYGNGNPFVLAPETVIPASLIRPFIRGVIIWALSRGVRSIYALGGIADANRPNVKEPKVFGVVSSSQGLGLLEEHGIRVIPDGYLVGPYAVLVHEARNYGIHVVVLLAQAYYNVPDPAAAAALLKVLSSMTRLEIDVGELIEQGEKIRLAARTLMRRAAAELERMKKTHELEAPPSLYV